MNIRNVADLKRYLIDTIKSFLEIRGIKELETNNDSPLVLEDYFNSDNTFLLDRIKVDYNGDIILEASSTYNNIIVGLDFIPVDYIEGIRDWLFDNEENIRENVLGEEMEEE